MITKFVKGFITQWDYCHCKRCWYEKFKVIYLNFIKYIINNMCPLISISCSLNSVSLVKDIRKKI